MTVSARPSSVALYGAVKPAKTSLLKASQAADYLDDIELLAGASSSFLYVLPANAEPFMAKVGLWNREFSSVPAGASVFIPLELRHLPSEFEDINQQIVDVLVHKVVAP